MGKELTTDIFIKRCVDKHGDLYDYSLVDYKKMKEKVDIRCVKHDIKFKQSPLKHLDSKTGGCPMCNSIGKGTLTTEVFIKKSKLVHDNLYDYRLVEYKKSNTKVRIICIKHGEFEITPNSHLNGRVCQKCAGNYKYSIEDLITKYKEIFGDVYEYDFIGYKNIKSHIKVKCQNHSYFSISAESHLKGFGCSSCGKFSIGENEISNYLESKNIEYEKQKSFDGCVYVNKMQYDFFIPSKNICIEYDGVQHFKPIEYFGGDKNFKSQLIKDKIKSDFCKKNGIKLVRIPYYEYKNIHKILENEI